MKRSLVLLDQLMNEVAALDAEPLASTIKRPVMSERAVFVEKDQNKKDFSEVGPISKLIFNLNGEDIELHAHEVIEIAQKVINAEPGTEVNIISPNNINMILDDLQELGPFASAAENGALDSFLFIPAHAGGVDRLKKWLFVAKYFADIHAADSVLGWWLHVAGRLLFLKNSQTDEHHFYVSDHGKLVDIVPTVKEIAFETPWTNPKYCLMIMKIGKELQSLSDIPGELDKFKEKFFANIDTKELREWHQDKTDSQLEEIIQSLSKPAFRQSQWKQSQLGFAYTINVLLKKFIELKSRTPDFDLKIYSYYGININSETQPVDDSIDSSHDLDSLIEAVFSAKTDEEESDKSENPSESSDDKEDEENFYKADQLIRRVVLSELAKEVNQGEHKSLFRPQESYGEAEKGAPYHSFAESVVKYFLFQNALTPQQIASSMRKITYGESCEIDGLEFLPNLVVAWFIGEAARNGCSIITSIMILDMIENSIVLNDRDGNNLYLWEHVLIHPLNEAFKKDKKIRISDVYGQPKKPTQIGGSHPMCHEGSKKQAAEPLKDGAKLNIMRQKEGSLILHWIYKHLKQACPDFPVELKGINDANFDPSPQYQLLAKIEKKIQKIQGDILYKFRQGIDHSRNDQELRELVQKKEKNILLCQNLIEPMLKLRLSSSANYYTCASKNQLGRIVKTFLGGNYYHFDKIESTDNKLLSIFLKGIQQIEQYKHLQSSTDLKREIISRINLEKEEYFNRIEIIILGIVKDMASKKIIKGVSEGFLHLIAKAIINLKNNGDRDLFRVSLKRLIELDLYCKNLIEIEDCHKEEIVLFAEVLGIRIDFYHDIFIRGEESIIKVTNNEPIFAYYSHSINSFEEKSVQIFFQKNGNSLLIPTSLGSVTNQQAVLKFQEQGYGHDSKMHLHKKNQLLNDVFNLLSDVEALWFNFFIRQESIYSNHFINCAAIGDIKNIKNMLSVNFSLLQSLDWHDSTALMHAAQGGHLYLIDLFISLGVDVNQQNRYGNTALIIAVKEFKSLYENIDFFHKSGVNESVIKNEKIKAIFVLLSRGAKLNIENLNGESAKSILDEIDSLLSIYHNDIIFMGQYTLKQRIENSLLSLIDSEEYFQFTKLCFSNEPRNIKDFLDVVALKNPKMESDVEFIKRIGFLNEIEFLSVVGRVKNKLLRTVALNLFEFYYAQNPVQNDPIPLLVCTLTSFTFREETNELKLHKEEYDFNEKLIPLKGNCLFDSVLMGATSVYGSLIPDNINTTFKLREKISEELLSHQTRYRTQVSHSIRDILYSALEKNDEFNGISEPFQIILKPMLKVLKFHTYCERKFLDDINSISRQLRQPDSETHKKQLSEKLDKLRIIQHRWNEEWQIYFDDTVLNRGYRAYCENLLADGTWGSQLELEMLAKLLKIRIEVYSDNSVNEQNSFIMKRFSGLFSKIAYSYTVNNDILPSIHLIHTGNNTHYNLLNPTEYGLRHYFHHRFTRLSMLSLLQREHELQKSYDEMTLYSGSTLPGKDKAFKVTGRGSSWTPLADTKVQTESKQAQAIITATSTTLSPLRPETGSHSDCEKR